MKNNQHKNQYFRIRKRFYRITQYRIKRQKRKKEKRDRIGIS